MADQNTQFYAILTNVGAAKQANADALGIPWRITQLGVGDANGIEPTPNATQTRLINEWRRAPLNQLKVDEKNNAIIVAEQIIPAEVGGKWIREIALYDADGDMVAVANCPPTYKPLLNQGSGRTQVVRMNLLVSSSSNVELKIDPAVVLATREYVDNRIIEEINKLDGKQSVRVATVANITLSGLQTVDGVQLVTGDRVLVKNQAAGKDNGLYVATIGVWARSADADASSEVTPGMTVSVEQGATLADTIWQLITDGPIVLGTTVLTFRDITDGFARLLSPAFTGLPTAPMAPQFDSSKQLATTEFLKRMGVQYGNYLNFSTSATLTLAECGKLVAFGHPTVALTAILPTGAIPSGVTVKVLCSQGTMTVTAAAGDTIGAINASGDIALGQGDTAEFIRNGTLWYLIGGSVLLRYAGVMKGATWITPAQFDSTRLLATTEFVQRALGSYAGLVTYPGSTALTAEDVGKLVNPSGAATITLPDASQVPQGALVTILANTGGATVQAKAGQTLVALNGTAGPLALAAASMGVFRRLNAGTGWTLEGGDAALKYSPLFASNLTAGGYEKSPGGLIRQWGIATFPATGTLDVTLPVTFPTQGFGVVCSYTYGLGGTSGRCGGGILNNSTIRLESSVSGVSGNQSMYWQAFGK